MTSSESTSKGHQDPLEFSRPFDVEKVHKSTPYKLDITATKEECIKLARRIGVKMIESLEAKFQITRKRGKELFAAGKVVAVVPQNEKADHAPGTLTFEIMLHLMEGTEEEHENSIDWENELVSDYDLEFYQNATVDFGEIVSQYLSLELLLPLSSEDDAFSQLTIEGLDKISDFSENKANEKKNPFEMLKNLKKEC